MHVNTTTYITLLHFAHLEPECTKVRALLIKCCGIKINLIQSIPTKNKHADMNCPAAI